ncbi:S-adenosyl-L-homocysteine hydrolase [uncultured Sulfitobacter sp.]|uniref:S-adenosyl-L-homocysteine hydrolase n=1 Tax=uncultured Sulfitobacter sp. TaxID=191468 RepID=UPI0026349E96|nr:S-adenosyl-L-homocysteine hydrolase [uncultured Sulfitobacter sp.]
MKTITTAVAALFALSTAVAADEVCMNASEMQSSLIDWYGERPVEGPSANNTRLWVSDATGSWTLVRTTDEGKACVAAQGRNWNASMDASDVLSEIAENTES